MESRTLLIGVSKSISERAIFHHIPPFLEDFDGAVFYVEGHNSLKNLILARRPDAVAISAKSPVAARKAIAGVSHLVLLWDGTDLSNLLFEARFQKRKTKLIPIQVTRVVNKDQTDDYDIYIGRGSPWGNPYTIGHGSGPDRAEVISKYREYFAEKIEKEEDFRLGILSMKGLRLACFCKPAACHGDVIAEYLDSREWVQNGGN